MAVQCVREISSSATMGLPNASADWPTAEEWNDGTDGLIGLQNLGNTCYQSCILQCLLNDKTISSLDQTIDNHVESEQTSIADNFLRLLRTYREGQRTAIRAEGVRDSMARRHVFYADGRQHDAQEFLDALHEELIRNHVTSETNKRQKLDSEDGLTAGQRQTAADEWNKFKTNNNSAIVDIFGGQLLSRVICDHCQHETTNFEPFFYLALPLPVVRHKEFPVVFSSLDGQHTRCLVSVDNKYDNILHLKNKLREVLSLAIEADSLVLTEVLNNGLQISRILDDSDDILTLSEDSEVCVFETRPVVVSPPAVSNVQCKQCLICLEERPITQLYSHCECESFVCFNCLEECVKHYADNCEMTSFSCPACARDVTKHCFTECPTNHTLRQFDIPLVFRSQDQTTTKKLLFRVLAIRVSSRMDWSQVYGLVDSRVPNPEMPYRLLFTERDGMSCCRCSWGSVCDGCELSRDGEIVLSESDSLCVHFETAPTQTTVTIVEDKSLAGKRVLVEEKPLDLKTCLQEFIANESLSSEDNQWFCSSCVRLRCAHKSFKVLRSPKTLIVCLKRFLFISNKSFKLLESVRLDDPLDLSPLTNGHAHRYRLNAYVCHSGQSVTSGHYTAFVRKDNKWYHLNDERVTAEEAVVADNRAYILFYGREEESEEPSEVFNCN